MMVRLEDVQRGFDAWASKPHNAKWVRKIDGTPIANDVVVSVFDTLKNLGDGNAQPHMVAVKPLEWHTYKGLVSYIVRAYDVLGNEFARIDLAPNVTEEQIKTFKQEKQADYEARIRSTLTTAPAQEPVAWLYQATWGSEDLTIWASTSDDDETIDDAIWSDKRPLYLTPPDQSARIAALEKENEAWRRNNRESFEALCAMRNTLNELFAMPILESDLQQGPETSVFCATVAEAVAAAFLEQAARIAELERLVARAKEITDVFSHHSLSTEEAEAVTDFRAALSGKGER